MSREPSQKVFGSAPHPCLRLQIFKSEVEAEARTLEARNWSWKRKRELDFGSGSSKKSRASVSPIHNSIVGAFNVIRMLYTTFLGSSKTRDGEPSREPRAESRSRRVFRVLEPSREPKSFSGSGSRLFLTYGKIEFFKKLINQVESNVGLLVRQIFFPNTLLNGPESWLLGDQNFF